MYKQLKFSFQTLNALNVERKAMALKISITPCSRLLYLRYSVLDMEIKTDYMEINVKGNCRYKENKSQRNKTLCCSISGYSC